MTIIPSSHALLARRATRCVHGCTANSRCSVRGIRKSVFGVTQIGVRWKTVSSHATLAICGISWTAVAPVPITATRLPVRSAASSHLAVWITSPAKSCTPSMSGSRGWDRKPVAVIRKRVVKVVVSRRGLD